MIRFQLDSQGITELERATARLMGQFEWISAIAITRSAVAARKRLDSEVLSNIRGGPVPWTRRGLIATPATPQRLSSAMGWNYGNGRLSDYGAPDIGSGVPSGRYMGILASGGDRRPKSFELALWRSGVVPQGTYAVINTRNNPVGLTPQGNLKPGTYTQMLSRLRSLGDAGNAPQGKGSRGRSGKGRASTDYFVMRGDGTGPSRWQLGMQPQAIVMRTGSGPKGGTGLGSGHRGRPQTVGYKRGFARVMNLMTDAPNYERRFDVQGIAMREFERVFPEEWRKLLDAELDRR